MDIDPRAVATAFCDKAAAVRALYEATEELYIARADLEALVNHFTLLGLEGTNESARRAHLATKTEAEREALAAAEKIVRQRRLELTLAEIEVDKYTLLVEVLGHKR